MGDYKIFTEVTADLTPEMVNEMNIEVIPMEIAFSGTESYMHYPDAREISFADFYHRLRAGEDITTAQVKYADYINIFEPILEKGEDIDVYKRQGYSGVAVFTKPQAEHVAYGFGQQRFDSEGRTLVIDYPQYRLINCYFPNGGNGPERLQYKMDFYEAFQEYALSCLLYTSRCV